MQLKELVNYTNNLLAIDRFKDYCPNGLQVEGRSEIKKIIGGVTASKALLDAAIEKQADAIVVHHGYFWRSESPSITGNKRERLSLLLNHDISLLAYHLPLDNHNEFGNNAQLARHLGFSNAAPLINDSSIWSADTQPLSGDELANLLERRLGRKPTHIIGRQGSIRRIMWCTGAAQNYFEQAIEAGADAYITGEISEQNFHIALEYHVDFFSAGHHATERYGVMALGAHLQEKFAIQFEFVEIDNPI